MTFWIIYILVRISFFFGLRLGVFFFKLADIFTQLPLP